MPFFLSHWYDSTPEKSRRKRDLNPGSSALEADALTTRPMRQSAAVADVVLTIVVIVTAAVLVLAPAATATIVAAVEAEVVAEAEMVVVLVAAIELVLVADSDEKISVKENDAIMMISIRIMARTKGMMK